MKPKLGKWQRLILNALSEAEEARETHDPPAHFALHTHLKNHLGREPTTAEYSAAYRAAATLEQAKLITRKHEPAKNTRREQFQRSLIISIYGINTQPREHVFERIKDENISETKRHYPKDLD